MSNRRMLFATALLLTGATPLVACNALTGIDDLVIGDSTGGAGGTTGAGGTSVSSPAATTGDGPSAVTSGEVAASSSTGAPQPTLVPADGVTITQIAMYQAVKRVLMQDGSTPMSKVPIVAARPALVRVFATVDGNYDGSPVTARLDLGNGSPIELQTTVKGSPSDGSLGSTINFDVPAELVVPGMAYRVDLLQPPAHSMGTNTAAGYPKSGTSPIPAQSTGKSLKIELVPVSYGADGSNRKPDTSAGQLQAYKDEFFKMYPVADVEILMHAAFPWNGSVDPNGNGWGELLDGIANLRQKDNAPPDVYYFGIFSPSSSVNQYCGGGCVAGLGMIGGPTDSYSRAAIGLGFSGDIATETAVHEIGHTHGRQHSPCGGAQGTDPAYPYQGASIGVWGYDLLGKKLLSPDNVTDVMGYCQPIWVSDFTYKAFFDRVKIVNNASILYAPELLDRTYQRARIDGNGYLTWMTDTLIHTPPSGQPQTITVQSDLGDTAVDAQLYPYDHLPGGVLVWPQPLGATKAITLQRDGKVTTLSRAAAAW
jgi:peptidase M66-like protein